MNITLRKNIGSGVYRFHLYKSTAHQDFVQNRNNKHRWLSDWVKAKDDDDDIDETNDNDDNDDDH